MTKVLRNLALTTTVVLAASIAGAGTIAAQSDTTITVQSLWGGSEQESFQKVLDAFKAETGITAEYVSVRDNYSAVLQTAVAGGTPPDVAIIPGIGFLRSFARDGSLQTVADLGLDAMALETNYPPGLLDIGKVDGELFAIPVKFNSKSTIWYRPDRFAELGVEPATDWESFLALIGAIKSAGGTPLGLGAGDAWTLTDWFESIYLRQAGAESYDQLFSGQLPWTDASVVAAIGSMKDVLNDDNVAGGITASLGRGFVDGIGQVFSADPQAEMYYEGGFVGGIATGQINPDLEIGTSIDFFDFPSIDGGDGVTIGADVIAAFTTNPGVAEFIEFMTTPASGDVWAATGAVLSPVAGVDSSVYPNALVTREAEQVANASAVRMDGGDLLAGGGDPMGAMLQEAIQGADLGPLLESYEQQATLRWESE